MNSLNWKLAIPWSMVIFRAMLGPLAALAAGRMAAPEVWLGAVIVAGLLSDVYDGILARRWKTASSALRTADSVADTIFYLGVLAAVVLRQWPVLHERFGLLAVLLALEALRAVFDWIKYRRLSSYHSYAAKLWGVLLATSTVALLCFNRGYWLLTAALAWGILCDLEGLTMTALLPVWTHDVKTLARALELRGTMLKKS